MKRRMTILTVYASVAVALAPAWSGTAKVAGQTDSRPNTSCESCAAGRSGPKVVGQTDRGATQIVGRGTAVKAGAGKATAGQPSLRSLAEKRRWLRDQLASGLTDRRQVQQLQAKIDNLRPQQVDVLTKAVLAQQLPAADQQQLLLQGLQQFDQQQEALFQQANQEVARAMFIRQALENELWMRNAGYGLGYMPVVTWLPEGTWFGAGATVSPDGRYVRTSVNPFYSSVGPVYTYNLNTGETRPWMPQSASPQNNRPLGYPGFNHAEAYGGIPAWHKPQPTPQAQPRVRYDGMRTRVGN